MKETASKEKFASSPIAIVIGLTAVLVVALLARSVMIKAQDEGVERSEGPQPTLTDTTP